MENGTGGVGRHGGARRLPSLRQVPLLPVSPPPDFTSDRSNGHNQAGNDYTTKERHRSSSNAQSSERDCSDDQGQPLSGRGFGAGSKHGYEAGPKNGIKEARGSGDEAKPRRGDRRGSREWTRNPGFDEAQLDEMSDRGTHEPSLGREESSRSRMENEGGLRLEGSGTDKKENPHERRKVRAADRLMERVASRVAQQREVESHGQNAATSAASETPRQQEPGSEAESSGGSRRSRLERSAAEEDERRRRKEERRIKRAEKEARRTERAERAARVGREGKQESQRGSEGANDKDQGTRDGSAHRVGETEQIVHSSAVSGSVGKRGDSESGWHKNRESNGASDARLQGGEGWGAAGDLRAGTSAKETIRESRDGLLREGAESAAPETGSGGRLARSTSIMNEAYEQEDEAVLLHSAIRFDEATGQLTSTLASLVPAVEEKKQRLYVEGGADGSFLRTHTDSEQGDGTRRWWRPAAWQRREGDDEDVEAGTSGGIVLRVACEQVAGFLAFVAHFANSLLGGFALLNFYLTYLYNADTLPGGFLTYYSPIAINCQRTFLVLTSICLLAACDKYAKDKLAEWKPLGSVQWRHDLLVILALFLAFVLSVVGTPFEDYVFQQNRTSPDWYSSVGSTAHFKARLKAWHVLNFVRLGACGVGFFVVMLDGNAALRTARAQNLQAARRQRTAAATVLANSTARGNTATRIHPATRIVFQQ